LKCSPSLWGGLISGHLLGFKVIQGVVCGVKSQAPQVRARVESNPQCPVSYARHANASDYSTFTLIVNAPNRREAGALTNLPVGYTMITFFCK
jgi:hypothetical protein